MIISQKNICVLSGCMKKIVFFFHIAEPGVGASMLEGGLEIVQFRLFFLVNFDHIWG